MTSTSTTAKNPVMSSQEPVTVERRRSATALVAAWWFEAVSLLGAVAALIAIAVTLKEFNEKEKPAWRYSINLNTIVSILSVLLRVCIVVVVEEVLSQMKWLQYRRPQPLRHFVQFDAAARGPWGALLLIFRIKKLSSAFFACVVVLLSLGIGPFTQQAVKNVYCSKPVDSSSSSTPNVRVARTISGFNLPRVASGSFDLDMTTKASILQSLADPMGNRSAITPFCPTGNCTFPSYGGISYSSVGLCKRCADITPWIKELQESSSPITGDNLTNTNNYVQYNLVLPNNISVGGGGISGPYSLDGEDYPSQALIPYNFLNATSGDLEWAFTSSNGTFEGAFLDVLKSSILNISIIALTQNGCDFNQQSPPNEALYNVTCTHPQLNISDYWGYVNAFAAACVLYPCIKNYHGEVDDTTFTETLISEIPAVIPKDEEPTSLHDYYQLNTPCVLDGQTYTLANLSSVPNNYTFNTTTSDGKNVSVPSDCFYGVGGAYIRALQEFTGDTITGRCDMPQTSSFNENSPPATWSTVTCKGWWIKSLFNLGDVTLKSIDANIEAIALAITNEMRNAGSGWDQNAVQVNGTAFRATVCTQFDWAWLAFPFALILLTMLALFIMVGKTWLDKQQIPIWKSSALPLLFAGNGVGLQSASEHKTEIEEEADKAIVNLNHNGSGWAFVGKQQNYEGGNATASGNDITAQSKAKLG